MLEKLQTSKWFRFAKTEGKRLVPYSIISNRFLFSACIKVPENIAQKSIGDYAGIMIDSVSPFLREQLAWGYYYLEDFSSIFLYAYLKEKLTAEERELLNGERSVFPSFFPLLFTLKNEERIYFLRNQENVQALIVEPDAESAIRVESVDIGESDFFTTKKALIKEISPIHIEQSPGYWATLPSRRGKSDEVVLKLHHFDDTGDQALGKKKVKMKLSEDIIYGADLRDDAVIVEAQKNYQNTKTLWKANRWIALGLTGVLFIAVLGLLGRGLLSRMHRIIDEQDPLFTQLQSKDTLTDKIAAATTPRMSYQDMLSELNVVRPKRLYFKAVNADASTINIEGAAASVELINQFTDRIRQLKNVEMLEVGETLAQAGKTSFKLTVEFKGEAES